VAWDDPALNIDWQLDDGQLDDGQIGGNPGVSAIVSAKDQRGTSFQQAEKFE
jgi:dTDP-4-dehydrorhamnose 3,5-epimerase-like enzyme